MLLSSSVAIVTLAFVATVQAEECATSELMTIASNSHLAGCTSALGFGGISAVTALSDEQVQKVCATPACLALMEDMRSMGFGDCTLQGTNISLESDMLDPFAKQCNGSGSVDLSSSTTSDEAVVGSASGSNGATMLTLSCIGTLSTALVTLLL